MESSSKGSLVSGAYIVIFCGLEEFGMMVIGSVVAAESSSVGCIRQYLLLESSQRSMLASCSWARWMASFWSSALAVRSSLWATATFDDWSKAIRPASLGKPRSREGRLPLVAKVRSRRSE